MSTLKRKMSIENDEQMPIKRVAINENEELQPLIKRVTTDEKKIKTNYKTVKGKLMNKTKLSIDNELYFYFKFLSEDKVNEYYGDSQCFEVMKENTCYELKLNYVKTKFKNWIQINSFAECNLEMDNLVKVNEFLTSKMFEDEQDVNAIVKLKYIYKNPNSLMYKIVYEINYKDFNDDECQVVQVECSTNAKFLFSMVKCDEINELLAYFKSNENNIFNIYNVKCQQMINNGNNPYYNWSTTRATRMELCETLNVEKVVNLKNYNAETSISRLNKRIISCDVKKLKMNMEENNQGDVKFVIQFKTDNFVDVTDDLSTYLDSDKWIRATLYVNKKVEYDFAQKLSADINQLAELLDDGLVKVVLFATVDNGGSCNMNVLSLLKLDDENDYTYL